MPKKSTSKTKVLATESTPNEVGIYQTKSNNSEITVSTTMPDELVRHNISDEELEMLSSWRTDHVTEFWYMAIGGTLGSTIPAFSVIYESFFSTPKVPLSFTNFLECSAFIVSITCLVLTWSIRRKRGDCLEKKIDEIRDRTNKTNQSIVSLNSRTNSTNPQSEDSKPQ